MTRAEDAALQGELAEWASRRLYIGASGNPVTEVSKTDNPPMEEESMTEDREDEEDSEPSQDDYVLTDSGSLGSKTSVSLHDHKFLAQFDEESEAIAFIRERMEKEQFWPNVWKLSDHGNWIGPLNLSEYEEE